MLPCPAKSPEHRPIGVVGVPSLNIYAPGPHRFSHFPKSSLNMFKPTASVRSDQSYPCYILTQTQNVHICIRQLLVAMIIAARVPAAPELLWPPWAGRILVSAPCKLLRTFEVGKIFLRYFHFRLVLMGFIFQVTLSWVPWALKVKWAFPTVTQRESWEELSLSPSDHFMRNGSSRSWFHSTAASPRLAM